MKKIFLILLTIALSYPVLAQDPKIVEVSIQKFREIRKDLENKKIAYHIDAGAIRTENFGKQPKEIVVYVTKDENGLKQILTTGSRP
jgi:hypothetical protein